MYRINRFHYFVYLATRPLLRQIENLQTTYVTQINSLEKAERQLTDRLGISILTCKSEMSILNKCFIIMLSTKINSFQN